MKRIFFTIILILVGLLVVYGQQERIDSLRFIINKELGIDKYEPLIDLVRTLEVNDNGGALESAYQALNLAYEFGDSLKIVNASRMIGILLNNENPVEAEKVLLQVLPIAKRNNFRKEYKAILSSIGVSYTFQAKFDSALRIHFQALILREADKDSNEISSSLNNIGLVYFKLRNYQTALTYYHRALKLREETNNRYDVDRFLINIGLCYNYLNDFTKAIEYFEKAFNECRNDCSPQIKIEGQFGLGVSYYGMNEFINAEKHFNESYLISKKLGDRRFQADNLIYLSKIYDYQRKVDLAIDALTECELIARDLGFNDVLINTYGEFSLLFSKLKNYEQASYYQNKYITLKDSIFSESLIDNLATVQTDYAQRENTATIATKEEVIQRQRSLNLAIGVIATLAMLLIFVLYQSIKVKKKVNQALSVAKGVIELKNIELDKKVADKTVDLEVANESLRKVNEELDNFIYKTSHDIRGPLASLKGICNVALMDVKDPLAFDYLTKLDLTAEHLNTILTRLLIINQINNSAMKPEVIDFDLIIEEVLLLEKKKGVPSRITITKHINPDIIFYSDKEFIRIILENLIDNAIKFHNNSSRVDPFVQIHVIKEEEHVKICVIDNGIGFSEMKSEKIFQMFSRASERSTTGGIGLYITKTATEKIGGVVGLKATPEGYTDFYARFPLKAQWFETPVDKVSS